MDKPAKETEKEHSDERKTKGRKSQKTERKKCIGRKVGQQGQTLHRSQEEEVLRKNHQLPMQLSEITATLNKEVSTEL